MHKIIYYSLLLISFGCYAQPLSLTGSPSPSSGSATSISSVAAQINDDTLLLNRASSILNHLGSDSGTHTRSVHDAALFKSASPSVVLIATKQGIGSGTIIGNKGEILTNWHVIENNLDVDVLLKEEKSIRRAKVIKFDQISDLALIQLVSVPAGRRPIKFGDISDISIGSDVHAIGHPKGESWTYTKGVVSQYRNEYEWNSGEPQKIQHRAAVIQTQTPINPGNSGGPLLSDNGLLLGVNSFLMIGSQGLNFAVSVEDVKRFIASKNSRFAQNAIAPAAPKTCEAKEVYRGKSSEGDAEVVFWDTKCTGKVDLEAVSPYKRSDLAFLRMDRNGDGKSDVIFFSKNTDSTIEIGGGEWIQSQQWNMSVWDNNYDGDWDLIGIHESGNIKPVRFENYKEFMAKK
jgi:S1-C subfamily serine protease